MPNLDFDGCNTLYATHGLHAFAAKCPPQLVKYGLRYYSKPGETVLDFMAGSGTTLVESRLMGRNAVGYDMDPLACLIATVKSRVVNDGAVAAAYEMLIKRVELDHEIIQRLPTATAALLKRAEPPEFLRRDYWFDEDVATKLALLTYHITETPMTAAVRDFFWVAFSSLIIAKNSVANARDIVHSRHHHWEHEHPPDVFGKFKARIKVMRRQMLEFARLCEQVPRAKVEVRLGDARRTRHSSESVDLIFSSPPYVTALDYSRAHFLAVAWMQRVFGTSLPEYKEHGRKYIGSESRCSASSFEVDEQLGEFPRTRRILESLSAISPLHAKLTQRYFLDMSRVMNQMQRVLKRNRHAIIVVCPSHIRKVEVPTHKMLIELARRQGFDLKQECTRTISARRRILPYMQESFGKRMSTEYVLIFQKK